MPLSGENHPNSKLTQEAVDRIRDPSHTLSDYALAEELGVERTTIRHVRLNVAWYDPNYEPKRPRGRGRPPKEQGSSDKEHPAGKEREIK